MKKSIKTAIFACVFAVAFQITAFAGFSWRVESADSSYVGTTNVTVTNTSGKKEAEDAPIVRKGAVVTFTEAAASATYTVKAYDGMGNPIRDFNASLGTIKKGGTLQYTLDWNARKSEGKSSYTGQAGVFEIQAKDSDGKIWRQRFVINNVCASGVLSNMYLYSKGALYQWKSNSKGWWVDKKSGGYLTNAWFQSPVSGLWYYMGADGYMLTNTTTPDGYKVNASGVWVK